MERMDMAAITTLATVSILLFLTGAIESALLFYFYFLFLAFLSLSGFLFFIVRLVFMAQVVAVLISYLLFFDYISS